MDVQLTPPATLEPDKNDNRSQTTKVEQAVAENPGPPPDTHPRDLSFWMVIVALMMSSFLAALDLVRYSHLVLRKMTLTTFFLLDFVIRCLAQDYL